MKTTVIIPFRNERSEVERTIAELHKFSPGLAVIAINDASRDNYDYASLAEIPNVRYIANPHNRGVAACRDQGARLAETPYLLFLDAHMYTEADIITPLVRFLSENNRALACLQTRVWEGIPPHRRGGIPPTCGCKINFSDQKLWAAEWQMLNDEHQGKTEIEIPCVMGAAYGISRDYYLYLHGLWGLTGWGCDEQYLATKVWLEGGRCVLLKDIEIGHHYRAAFPYSLPPAAPLRNKLLITQILTPERFDSLVAQERTRQYLPDTILCELEIMDELIQREREYLSGIFTRDFDFIHQLNR